MMYESRGLPVVLVAYTGDDKQKDNDALPFG